MKNKFLFTIAIASLLLTASCALDNGYTDVTPTESSEAVSTSAASSANEYLADYTGIWYGFGTDGTEAQTPANVLDFTGDGRFLLGSDAYTLIDKYTAESDEDIQDSLGNPGKTILQFGKDSNGELALNCYGIRKSDGMQFTEAMCFYREQLRVNIQDFIPNTVARNNSANTSASEEMKNQFTGRAQDIEEYDRVYFQNAMSQASMNAESKKIYDMWDALLNDIYRYLKSTKSEQEFAVIQADEKNWVNEKEAAANNAAAEFEGGTMAPLVHNTTASEYTKNRCYYLISLID